MEGGRRSDANWQFKFATREEIEGEGLFGVESERDGVNGGTLAKVGRGRFVINLSSHKVIRSNKGTEISRSFID